MRRHSRRDIFLACLLALAASGCARRKVIAAPPSANAPASAEPAARPAEGAAETKPNPAPLPSAPPTLVVPPPRANAPARPNVVGPPAGETSAPRPAAPQISPRLSAEEQAQYRRETSEAIVAAEKDLQSLSGKRVTTNERDLIEKIRGFLAQAHEGLADADLVRARTLAQKALVLSAELVGRR